MISTTGSPRLVALALLAALALSACEKKPEAPVAQTPAAEAPTEAPLTSGPESFEAAVAAFDYKTQHVIWVLPPGVQASGPFEADVVVAHNGVTQYEQTIPLQADFPAAGSRPEYPSGSVIIRLSADETWASRLAEIKDVIDRLTAEHGPGGGELTIASNFKTDISDDVREAYCGGGAMPDIGIYLEQDDRLAPLVIGASAPLLRSAILIGCQS